MLTETVTAIGGLKTAFEVAKTLIQAKSESERLAAISELQMALVEIQQHTLNLQVQTAELQDEVISLRRSNETMQRRSSDLTRYRLISFPETGASAYQLEIQHMSPGEINHYLCTNCYSKGEKSILQTNGIALNCPACSMKIYHKTANYRSLNCMAR